MTEFNQQQKNLINDIREAIENHTSRRANELTREEISDVLEHETIQVEFGSKENYFHLEHLGKPVNKKGDGE